MNVRRLGLVAFGAVLLVFGAEQARSSSEDGDKAGAVAAEFINAYVKAISKFDGYLEAVAWVRKHPLASPSFKQRLEELYRKALEDDPEMGYGSDAVLSAQDFPDAYTVESVRVQGDRAVVELKGVPPVPLPLRMILIRDGESWLVDGSGDLAKAEEIEP